MALTKVKLFFLADESKAAMLAPWDATAGYSDVPSFAVGSDGTVYKSTVANGVDEDGVDIGDGAIDPVGDLTGTWEEFATAGAVGGGSNKVFFENDIIVNESYTITTDKNAMSAGPVQIGEELTITNISSDGVEIDVTTSTANGYVAGDEVTITDTTNYDGVYTIASTTSTTEFSITSALNESTETSGSVEKSVTVTVPDGSTWTVV